MPSEQACRLSRAFWLIYPVTVILIFGYMLLCGLDYGDPVRYHASFTETPVVRQDKDLRIHYTFDRLRVCALTRLRVIIDGLGAWHEVSRDYKEATGPITFPGQPEEIDVKVPITREMEPGKAAYRVILSYECPLHVGPITVPNIFQQYTPKVVVAPDVPFRILPAHR
jgi:hypothetical protein